MVLPFGLPLLATHTHAHHSLVGRSIAGLDGRLTRGTVCFFHLTHSRGFAPPAPLRAVSFYTLLGNHTMRCPVTPTGRPLPSLPPTRPAPVVSGPRAPRAQARPSRPARPPCAAASWTITICWG